MSLRMYCILRGRFVGASRKGLEQACPTPRASPFIPSKKRHLRFGLCDSPVAGCFCLPKIVHSTLFESGSCIRCQTITN
jgi:hypothetical protein